jgi:ribosome maturation factor RimP
VQTGKDLRVGLHHGTGVLPVFLFFRGWVLDLPEQGINSRHFMKIQNKKTNPLVAAVEAIAESLCPPEGLELVHVECVSDRTGMIFRIYLDKPGGITIDDCALMSRKLGDIMDVELEEIAAYRLEVSSPGAKRPLKKQADFERFLGSRVKVETTEPIGDRRKFTGILSRAQDGCVEVVVNNETIVFRLEQIAKSRLA